MSLFFSGIMDTHFLIPFMQKFPSVQFRFQQDNDTKHTSRVARNFFMEISLIPRLLPVEKKRPGHHC